MHRKALKNYFFVFNEKILNITEPLVGLFRHSKKFQNQLSHKYNYNVAIDTGDLLSFVFLK